MKGILIGADKKLDNIRPGTKMVAVAYRPSIMDILEIIKKGKNINVIFVPNSSFKTIGKSAIETARMNGIKIKNAPERFFQGKRIDINGPEIEIPDTEE